jgi:hypothetical protein
MLRMVESHLRKQKQKQQKDEELAAEQAPWSSAFGEQFYDDATLDKAREYAQLLNDVRIDYVRHFFYVFILLFFLFLASNLRSGS